MERFVFTNKARAEVALEQMNQLIDLYGVASRADMLHIYGITPKPEDQKFGWTDLSNAYIESDLRTLEFVLGLPRALRLE